MRINKFIARAKLAILILLKTKRQHVCIMNCPSCGSINIMPMPEYQSDSTNDEDSKRTVELREYIDYVWKGYAVCCNCGAACAERQIWIYRKDEKK